MASMLTPEHDPWSDDMDDLLKSIEQRGNAIMLQTTQLTTEQLVRLHYALPAVKTVWDDILKATREGIIERMRDLGLDEIVVDARRRLYLGVAKPAPKPKDVEAIFWMLLEEHNADALRSCLNSDPFKPAAVRAVVGEEEGKKLFTRTEKTTVKEGKPTKAQVKLLEVFDMSPTPQEPHDGR